MHRLLVATERLDDERPVLPSAALKHLKVLRLRDGEAVELFDGRGSSRSYGFLSASAATASPLQARSPRVTVAPTGPALTLFACVTKGSRWDWTLEKATEIGVTRIVPVISERTIVRLDASERESKRERWQRIVEAAACQSDAKFLPEVTLPVDFATALKMVESTTCFVGALVTPSARPLAAAVTAERTVKTDGLAVFVGPEGDFAPAELADLLKRAIPTSFGPTVLRAETAAIFAVSVIKGIRDANRD